MTMSNKRYVLVLLVLLGALAIIMALSSPAVAAQPASAAPASVSALATGSDNGTNNWYSSDYCTASGGRLDITNYDVIVSGSVWQEYHIDADRAGGTGAVPKVYWRLSGTSSWALLSYWNDFYVKQSNQWLFNDFKVTFANGSACYIIAL